MSTATTPEPAVTTTSAPLGAPKVQVHHLVRRGRRLFIFTSIAVVLAGANSWLFADLLWRLEWSLWHTILLVLFFILSFGAAFGCLHAVYGFGVLNFGDRGRITQLHDYKNRALAGVSTAIVVPIYNEDVVRVYEGLRVMFASLRQTGELDRFDFFILSDSTHPGKWVQEETRWFEMCRELGAFGRIHYRRRTANREKKSGNIRDFLNAWGRRYRYMIVLDADSIMHGRTIVDLVKLMEANPTVGLIQTVPGLINNTSLFGRLQQFSSRLFGPLFVAGLNYWVQDGGNYWGHNAIIRVEPFMHNCDLPTLPGKKPFGGHILSHDFVEAALLRREDWQVWLAWDLDGSWEEGPQSLVDFAQRDRRWCQGNLQHALLLFAKGFRGISRVHMILGILGYMASPLWLAFMLVYAWIKFYKKNITGLSDLPVAPTTPFLKGLTVTEHGLLVFCVSMSIIFLPKFIAMADLAISAERRMRFGGWCRSAAGVFVETLVSALHAPILMLFHTQFVITNLLGWEVGWGPQNRLADGTAWRDAIRAHWWHTLAGIAWGLFSWIYIRDSFWWFLPVLVGLVLSIPISVLMSRKSWGDFFRKIGLLVTPEELAPPPEVAQLAQGLRLAGQAERTTPDPDARLSEAVVDPYANAIHVSLLREKILHEGYVREMMDLGAGSDEVKALRERLLREGPPALSNPEKLRVMSDSESMAWLHSRVWTLPASDVAPWWQSAIRSYEV
ncbi:MAG: glucans biosynthesis glucosyltransferase MdoH [Verrucomicrobiales bacterium]